MAVYTVHEPRPRRNGDAAPPERYAFVRDGFYLWAFLLGPLWMLWHRLWLVLGLYVVAMGAIEAGMWALGLSGAVKFAVMVLIAILVGCEAGTLRRFGLRRWTEHGIVVADDREEAERRFFDRWTGARVASPPLAREPLSRPVAPHQDVIGLFPQPQSPS
ncbi:MAG TPA: DUF2628 domain-containing protein [Xanthobacteraceae bacterium]|jgi:hypothetical protein|nr:DUF2628 domain-containing protein [Xanthobacteraceae bacterium]